MHVSHLVAHSASSTPANVAHRFEAPRITSQDRERPASALAADLAGLVGSGDRVPYLGLIWPELIEAFFASARRGAHLVPLNAQMRASELHLCAGRVGSGSFSCAGLPISGASTFEGGMDDHDS
jgi:acyl-CoA synthetase (AMP-forming)/AMP-acid ligase II